MADVEAAIDGEGVEDGEEVVDEGVEGCVTAEIEVIGVNAAGADEVVEDDAVGRGEVRQNAIPNRLVSPGPVGEDQVPLPRPDHPNIQSLQDDVSHVGQHNTTEPRLDSPLFVSMSVFA